MTDTDTAKSQSERVDWFRAAILNPLMARGAHDMETYVRRVVAGRQSGYIALERATREALGRVLEAKPGLVPKMAEAAHQAMEEAADVYGQCDPTTINRKDWRNDPLVLTLKTELRSLTGGTLHHELDDQLRFVDLTDAQKREIFTKMGEMVQMLAMEEALAKKMESGLEIDDDLDLQISSLMLWGGTDPGSGRTH